ncbi:MAG: hypothetical protein ACRCYU_11960 [Nocardioides sp.]
MSEIKVYDIRDFDPRRLSTQHKALAIVGLAGALLLFGACNGPDLEDTFDSPTKAAEAFASTVKKDDDKGACSAIYGDRTFEGEDGDTDREKADADEIADCREAFDDGAGELFEGEFDADREGAVFEGGGYIELEKVEGGYAIVDVGAGW